MVVHPHAALSQVAGSVLLPPEEVQEINGQPEAQGRMRLFRKNRSGRSQAQGQGHGVVIHDRCGRGAAAWHPPSAERPVARRLCNRRIGAFQAAGHLDVDVVSDIQHTRDAVHRVLRCQLFGVARYGTRERADALVDVHADQGVIHARSQPSSRTISCWMGHCSAHT